MGAQSIFDAYAAAAEALIPGFDALDTAEILAPVGDLLPARPARILDVGAGTGRDAAWLAARGHDVTAVEPVRAFRRAGMDLHGSAIRWVDDRLPGLDRVRTRRRRYDLILLVGVWHHLPPALWGEAISTLAGLTARGGRLLMSLRHGPGAPGRPSYPIAPGRIVALARASGLEPAARRRVPSIQEANRAAGVTWTWLCLDRPPGRPPEDGSRVEG